MKLPFKLPKLGTKAGLIVVTLAAVTIAYVADNFISFLTLAERTVEDIRVASALPTEPQDPDIVIVGITEDTLKQFPYREPVDHAFLADLLKFIESKHPRAVGVDILFDQATEDDKDDALKKVIADYSVPLIVSYTDNPDEVNEEQLDFLNNFVPPQDRVQANLPEDDGIVRTIPKSKIMRDGKPMPGFAHGLVEKLGIDVPDKILPIAWHGSPALDVKPFKILPAHTLKFLPPAFADLSGKVVLVGGYFTLRDNHRTPFSSDFAGARGESPGIEVHAHAISQFLHNRSVQKPTLLQRLAILLLCAAVGAGIGALNLSTAKRFGLAGLAVALLWVSGFALSRELGIMIRLIEPTLGLLMATWAADAVMGAEAKRQREFINSAFARYLNPQLVKRLADDPSKLTLGGESRDMTLLFCDIRGFTTISEKFDAQGLTRFINRFLTPMTDLIMANRGTIDKYMGDAIMAFWNAPLDDPEHAANGCRAALLMRSRLAELNRQWRIDAEAQQQPFIEVNIGIGLNSGICCVGNVGSDQRFDYSVLGDDVNLASRLEGQSKTYGVDIVIGENTARAASTLAVLELDSIKVKGKTKPVQIYALVGDDQLAQEEGFKQLKTEHEAMIATYRRQDWKSAVQHLERCRDLAPPLMMGLYQLYEERVADYLEAPPPVDWDGVYVALSK
ncbi:MAG TPA: adenylate/guanylate cyclase domain-containing protein [Magnetospirillaceae bacterium]|nr:adenylate/guanylate cyclase domain-containing protein [Magnetospirillaceae bacterium]